MAEKYNKVTWINDETQLSPANMNRIENGIEAATNTANSCSDDIEKIKNGTNLVFDSTHKTIELTLLDKKYPASLDGLSEKLAEEIDDKINSKIDAKDPGVLSAYVVYSTGEQQTMEIANGGSTQQKNTLVRKGSNGEVYGQTVKTNSGNSYVNVSYLESEVDVKSRKFTNPVLTNSSTSDYFPDPTVWQGNDGYFYAFSTTYDKHLFRSVDLVNWEDCGHSALDETSEATLWSLGYNKIWAPSVHKVGTKWNLYMGAVRDNTDTKQTGIVVMTSNSPYGPFKNPIMLVEGTDHQDNIDPFVYSEYNELYLVYGGSYGIWKTRLDDTGTKIIGSFNRIAGLTINDDAEREKVFEGAYIYRRGIYQYLFVSSGKTNKTNYKLRVGRATLQSNGAWSEYVDRQGNRMLDGYAETILTDSVRSPGHNGNIFVDSLGKTYMFYHARLKNVSSGWKRAMYLQELKWDEEGWCYFENGSIADTEIYPYNVRYQDNSIGCSVGGSSSIPENITVSSIEHPTSISLKINGIERFKFQGAEAITGRLYPSINNVFDLGTASLAYKDIYLSGNIKNETGNITFTVKNNGMLKPSWDGHYNLGGSSYKWKDLYLSGNISNGSQSFSVNDFIDLKNALYGSIFAVEPQTYENVGVAVIDRANGYPIVDNQKAQVMSIKGKTEVRVVMKSVDMGTFTFKRSGSGFFCVPISDIKTPSSNSEVASILCSKYQVVSRDNLSSVDKACCVDTSGSFLINDTSYTDIATFTTNISGTILTYATNENEIVNTQVNKITTRKKYVSVDLGTLDYDNPLISSNGTVVRVSATIKNMKELCESEVEGKNLTIYSGAISQNSGVNLLSTKTYKNLVYINLPIDKLGWDKTSSIKPFLKTYLSGVILYYQPANITDAEILTDTHVQTIDLNGIGSAQDEMTETTLTRVIDSVDMGTFDFEYQANARRFAAYNLQSLANRTNRNILCTKYKTRKTWDDSDESSFILLMDNGILYIRDLNYTDTTSLKQALSGQILYYGKATPTVEENGLGEVLVQVERGGIISTDSIADITTAHVVYKPIGD